MLGSASLGPSTDLIDFGYRPYGYSSIGDTIFNDSDADGIQDSSESGIPFISVTLFEDSNVNGVIDSSDAVVATTVSDAAEITSWLTWSQAITCVDVDTADADLPTDFNGQPYVLSTSNDPHLVVLGSAEPMCWQILASPQAGRR